VAATLRIAGLEKSFGAVRALAGVDLTVGPGETVGLLGPNGSGKTTLVNCVSGVTPASRGTVSLGGRDLSRASRAARARAGIIRTYQNLRLFGDLTVAENVESGLVRLGLAAAGRRAAVTAAIAEHGLARHAHMPVRDLPYGLQKRTEIARAIVAAPSMLLLDEPAAGLSDGEARDLASAVAAARARLGFGVLLIDHNVGFVSALADSLVVLVEGRVLRSGLPADVVADPEVARVYLGATLAAG
jgi:ABC-type branched-subunit amino acid transport system ATPase component